MRRTLASLFSPPALWDVLGFAGLTLIVGGLALIWWPLVLLVLGGVVLLLGVWGASTHGGGSRKRRRRQQRERVMSIAANRGRLADPTVEDDED